MIPHEMISLMERRRLVAEVRTDTAIQALGVVDALAAAGITSIEISHAIPGALEILTHLATRQDVFVGMGAVLEAQQAKEAISCGARFISAPIVEPELVPVCRDANVTCILGALTPTEIITAQRAGAEMVKVFPIDAMGGAAYIRSLLQQLTHVSLQVSGTFGADKLGEYLALPVRTIALGQLLVPRALVDRGNWQAITARARAFMEYVAAPHANAERFLAMMGLAPVPRPAAPAPNPAHAIIAQIPTVSVPPELNPALAPVAAQRSAPPQPPAPQAPQPQARPSAPSGEFKPWDSRPLEQGDEEDWLR